MMTEVVIRLQNLPLTASSSDVRQFFNGLDIPNGGVRIIGGPKGDCFIVFSNSQDARDALRKDGFWLKDQQIVLFPSSQGEMQQVMSIAKGEIPDNSMHQPNPQRDAGNNVQLRQTPGIISNSNTQFERGGNQKQLSKLPYRDQAVQSRGNQQERGTHRNAFDNSQLYNDTHGKPDYNDSNRPQHGRYRDSQNTNPNFRDNFQRRNCFNQDEARDYQNEPGHGSYSRGSQDGGFNDMNTNQDFRMGREMVPGTTRAKHYDEKFDAERNPPNLSRSFNQMNDLRPPPPTQMRGPDSYQPDHREQNRDGFQGPQRDGFQEQRRGQDDFGDTNNFSGRGFQREFGGGRNSRFNSQPNQDNKPPSSAPDSNRGRGRSGSFNQRDDNSNYDNMRERGFENLSQSLPNQWQGSHIQRNDRDFHRDSRDNQNRSHIHDSTFSDMRRHAEQGGHLRENNFPEKSFLDRRPSRDSDMRPQHAEKAPVNQSRPPSKGLLPTPSESSDANNSGPIKQLLDIDTRFHTTSDRSKRQDRQFDNRLPPHQSLLSVPQSFSQPPVQEIHPGAGGLSSNLNNPVSAPIAVGDPCTVITHLPPDVRFKQIRGLMATHDIKCFNIAIVRGPVPAAPSTAYVLHDDINNTVLALNELQGMKVAGSIIDIKPCSRADYEDAVMRSRRHDTGEPMNTLQTQLIPNRIEDRFSHKDESFTANRERDMRRDRRGSDRNRHVREDRYSAGTLVGRSRSPDLKQSNSPHRSSRSRSSAHSQPKASSPPWRSSSRNSGTHRSRSPSLREDSRRRSRSPRHSSRDRGIKNNGSSRNQTWCAVITGLPPKSNRADLEDYLSGIGYEKESLYLELNVHNECTGTAYVTLKTKKDQDNLLSQQRDIHMQSIHVSAINAGQMKDYVEQHRAQLANDTTKPGEFIIQLVGLPYEATPKVIQEFLYPAKIKASDITIVKKNDGTGRCNGNGFAKVYSIEDRDESLKHDRGYIGKRYVCVKVISQANMQDFLAKKEQVVETGVQIKNPEVERTVNVANLRYDIKAEEVEEFFREFNPEIGSIKFIMANGMPTGRATVRLGSAELAQQAVDKLGKKELAGRSVILSQAY